MLRLSLSLSLIFLALTVLTFPAYVHAQAPHLSAILPTAVSPGTQMTLTGSGFGATQGSGAVYFGGPYSSVASWSDTKVVVTVPTGIAPDSVLIVKNNVNSNALAYTVIPATPTSILPNNQIDLKRATFSYLP